MSHDIYAFRWCFDHVSFTESKANDDMSIGAQMLDFGILCRLNNVDVLDAADSFADQFILDVDADLVLGFWYGVGLIGY